MKRSQVRLITKKAQVLRYMRQSRNISQAQAAKLCGISVAAIGHYENGRMNTSQNRLDSFLNVYNFTQEEFWSLMAERRLPQDSVCRET